jgi:DNA-binding SARP family transcriptional activator
VDETRGSVSDFPRPAVDLDGAVLGALFHHFPYGVVLLNSSGLVVAANPLASQLLRIERGSTGLSCCDLLGCRTPGTQLERGCVTEMAIKADDSLTEIRIDLPLGSGADAVWLSFSELEHGPGRVLLHLRPADRRDRRRHNLALWHTSTQLEIFTLGRTMVTSAEGSLGGEWLRQRAGVLLKYLISERHRTVSADEIAEALWPTGNPAAVGNVRHFIHRLRSYLEPTRRRRTPSRFILAESGGYRLNTDAVRVDADEFEHAIQAGLSRLRHGALRSAQELLVEGMRLYGGDFLADERYALWALSERDELRDLAGEALGALAVLRRREGDLSGAAAYLERRAEMYPLDPDAQRDVIAAALEQGKHTLAKRRYTALKRRMLQEFGREPSFDLPGIAASVAAGEFALPGDDPGARAQP